MFISYALGQCQNKRRVSILSSVTSMSGRQPTSSSEPLQSENCSSNTPLAVNSSLVKTGKAVSSTLSLLSPRPAIEPSGSSRLLLLLLMLMPSVCPSFSRPVGVIAWSMASRGFAVRPGGGEDGDGISVGISVGVGGEPGGTGISVGDGHGCGGSAAAGGSTSAVTATCAAACGAGGGSAGGGIGGVGRDRG